MKPLLAVAILACGLLGSGCEKSAAPGHYVARPKGSVTFNRDIAPIVFQQCAVCHRPGQAAPFALLTCTDAQKHAKEILDVTQRRFMPPWLPEPGHGNFADARSLNAEQIGLITQWVAEGMTEGAAADLPAPPVWGEGWLLGQPDLVVTVPQAYALAAEGKDVYRNLVVPIPTSATRFVKAVEFHPGNPKVVHHAFIDVDRTRQSRRLAEKQNPPGFDGMRLPDTAVMPGGQLLGWQPGKVPYVGSAGLAWVLEPNTDLVLQLHLHPSGKPELVQPSVGFYFTGQPPTNTAFRLNLSGLNIDIPAGAADYAIEESYALPVDVDALRISVHTHYLGKELQGYATLPDGRKEWLLRIKQWDFNWQGDYRYATPVSLPKGTKLTMHFTFDNSAANVRNPSRPPKRVQYGLETTDEMGELWLQVLPRRPEDLEALRQDFYRHLGRQVVAHSEFLLRQNPNDAVAHTQYGRALMQQGQEAAGLEHLRAAIAIQPDYDRAHYELGYYHLLKRQPAAARQEFETVVRINADDYQAHGNLGLLFLQARDLERAEEHLVRALQLNPDDAVARKNLDLVQRAKALGPR